MGTKLTKVRKGLKTQRICEYCGRICSNKANDFVHKDCAIDYLQSSGYVILDFDLQRVFFGGKK